jgi:hypothetical protein
LLEVFSEGLLEGLLAASPIEPHPEKLLERLQTIAPKSLLKVKLRILIVSPSNSNFIDISVNTSKNILGVTSIITGVNSWTILISYF